jgi:hypothetical protein
MDNGSCGADKPLPACDWGFTLACTGMLDDIIEFCAGMFTCDIVNGGFGDVIFAFPLKIMPGITTQARH